MLIAFAGITGIGKSYYKDKLVEKLGFDKIKIITTRQIRNGEKNNDDKVFVTLQELESLRKGNKIAYEFEMLDNIYDSMEIREQDLIIKFVDNLRQFV